MIPVVIQNSGSWVHNPVASMLGKALDDNISIAICGPVGSGKTTLLRRLVAVLKTKGFQVMQFDFEDVIEDGQGNPDYIIVDHPSSLHSLKKIREKYPDVPLLAVLYKQPEMGFDILVQVWPPRWGNAVIS